MARGQGRHCSHVNTLSIFALAFGDIMHRQVSALPLHIVFDELCQRAPPNLPRRQLPQMRYRRGPTVFLILLYLLFGFHARWCNEGWNVILRSICVMRVRTSYLTPMVLKCSTKTTNSKEPPIIRVLVRAKIRTVRSPKYPDGCCKYC